MCNSRFGSDITVGPSHDLSVPRSPNVFLVFVESCVVLCNVTPATDRCPFACAAAYLVTSYDLGSVKLCKQMQRRASAETSPERGTMVALDVAGQQSDIPCLRRGYRVSNNVLASRTCINGSVFSSPEVRDSWWHRHELESSRWYCCKS